MPLGAASPASSAQRAPGSSMVVIGLTGNVASGKSTVAELWRSWGTPVVSADLLARRTVEVGTPGLDEVRSAFGAGVLKEDGSLDRDAMRRLVFQDDGARRRLEEIIHPRVRDLRDAWTAERRAWGVPWVSWEIPLLFETGAHREVDAVVLVDAPEAERLRRMTEYRGLEREEAEAVMRAQGTAQRKRRLADEVVDNDGSLDDLRRRARAALEGCLAAVGVDA